MKLSKTLVALLVVGTVAFPALAKKDKKAEQTGADAAKTANATTEGDVAAYLGDEPISRQELDKMASGALMKVRQDEYNIRRNTLDQIVQQRLLDREAQSRKMTLADLLKVEVDDKAGNPTKEEIDKFYEQNKARMQGKTLEQMSPDIEKSLRQQKLATRRAAFYKELQDKAKLRVMLEPPRVTLNIAADAPVRGPADAKVTVVEYSDYQCPFCKRAQPTVTQLLKDYGDKIRFVYRDYPLPFHPRAMPSSLAAGCARDQGKYWEFHENLMDASQQGDLSDDDLKKRAATIGMDSAAFGTCYEQKKHETEVKASYDEGSGAGVTGTPTFFVNGRMMVGALPLEQFKSMIDEELARLSPKSEGSTK